MDSWLRSLAPGWVSRLPVDRRLPFDVLLAGLLAVATLTIPLTAEASDFTSTTRPDSLPAWLLAAGASWAVPLRRVRPRLALALGVVLQLTVWSIGFPDTFLSMAVLLYSAAAHGPRRLEPLVWATVVVLTLYTGFGVIVADVPIYALPLVGLFAAAAASLGATNSTGRAYAEAAEARALELERSRQADRDRALAEERSRIARELHDVVAHGLSVIVVQAAAAQRILDRDPEGAATALGQIEATGRDALGEMRHVLAAIRTEPEDSWQPTRGLADLDALVAELGRTGLPVEVVREQRLTTGDAADAGATDVDGSDRVEPLPATVDVTAYRIVRESLTNVLKHGGDGATARVEIVRQPTSLELRISDDGRGALADDGGGHGLRGMQERVEVFGGRFRAGPRLGGGFTVEATLPLETAATRTGSAVPRR
ncbi:MAG: sensor histidine kinase [Actinomycetota bacterium]